MSDDYASVARRGADRGRSRGRGSHGFRGGRGQGSYSSNRGSRGIYRGQNGSNRGRYNANPTIQWDDSREKDESADLRRLLDNMSKSITMLSERVDRMQNNRGLDKKTDGKVDRPKPTNIARPPATKSNNDDFATVTKTLYRLVQLRHHETNWNALPASISSRLKSLADDIKPPASDDDFRTAMADLTTQFGESIRQLVNQHLRAKVVQTEVAAGRLNDADIDRAKEVATKYINTRLGKRLPENRRATLLQQAANSIGIHRQPPPRSSPDRQQPDQDGWTEIESKQRTTITDSTRKRPAPGQGQGQAIKVSNRFQSLSDSDTNEMEDDDNSVRSTPPSQNQRRLKKFRQSSDRRQTKAGVNVYEGSKFDWLVEPKDDTTTVVIGDSNLKGISVIPKNWEVHSLPGARLSHVVGAISRLDTITQQVNVVVHVGINHRTKVDSRTDDDLADLANELKDNSAIGKLFFAGTSIAVTLPEDEAKNVHLFNDKVRKFIHDSNYIPPLSVGEVDINEHDSYGIHYTTKTADRIMHNIEEFVNQTVFC